MPSTAWAAPIVTAQLDGPTLTSAAAASCLSPQAIVPIEAGYFAGVGKKLRILAQGKISNAVTTPGTARFDVRFGATVVFDGLAVPLNLVAKANVAWWLEIELTAQIVGAVAQLMGHARFSSEAVVGSPLPSVGGSGLIHLPYNTAPVLGAAFDSTVAQVVDLFFTQTVATGSLTLQQYELSSPN